MNEIETDRTTVVFLSPIVVCDADPEIASSAALDW
jgi:hypothetical protein